MAIACPYCKHSIALKNVKPGKYAPKCPKCLRAFQLVVLDDPDGPHIVRAIAAASTPAKAVPTSAPVDDAAATAFDPNATGAVAPAPAVDPGVTAGLPIAAEAAAESDVTGEFSQEAEGPPSEAESEPGMDQTVAPASGSVSAAKPPPKQGPKQASTEGTLTTLGGYQVVKLLGKGGMGAVYLARQVSLDRFVAVKVMLPKAAADPAFVARFTREAYAAAQLVHHNVVQIYDIGSDKNTHYFSMEYVKGESLMDVVRREGRLDPEQAVGYILQAARGLKYGHDMGMVHRDVKPDNLMVNDQGIVKVADMGLVKLSDDAETEAPSSAVRAAALARQEGGSNLTRVGFAMGTPSYMSPEQAMNSSTVGPAADVYSLGCTLYVLLTGKPPFEGKTVLELLTKHAKAPIVRPDAVVKRVPKALADILVKMLAKTPETRYPDMGAVIETLETYLGVLRAGPFSPSEEHADALEKSVKQFNEAPTLKVRRIAVLGYYGAVVALLLLSALFSTTLAGGFLGLALLTPVFSFLIRGFTRKTPLFLKVRELVLASGPRDWIVWGVSVVLLLVLLLLFGMVGSWIVFSLLATVAALAMHYGLDRRIEAERAPAVAAAEKLFKSMRLQGLDEASLRQFVCKYSGSRWEEYFETLFGYEAKREAREWGRGEMGKAREKFVAWREPLIAWIDARQAARKAARERKHLQAVEVKALKAAGMNAAEAEAKAEQVAEAMVEQAAVIKAAAAKPVDKPSPAAIPLPVAQAASVGGETIALEATAPTPAPANLKKMLETVRKPEKLFTLKAKKKTGPGAIATLFGELFGSRMRFLLGAALLSAFLLWLYQNDLLAVVKILKQVQALLPFSAAKPKTTAAMWLPLVPLEASQIFGTVYAGIAGLILIVSGVFSSRRMTVAVVPGAAAVLVAPWVGGWLGLPSLGPLDASLALLVVGLVLAFMGFVLLRKVRYSGPRAYDEE